VEQLCAALSVYINDYRRRNMIMGKDKSRDRLERVIKDEITKMFESVLDYAQVACPTTETYKVLRSKILRVGNNCIRSITKGLDRYSVEAKTVGEDVIEFKEAEKIKQ
jgi:hypothetical protein